MWEVPKEKWKVHGCHSKGQRAVRGLWRWEVRSRACLEGEQDRVEGRVGGGTVPTGRPEWLELREEGTTGDRFSEMVMWGCRGCTKGWIF